MAASELLAAELKDPLLEESHSLIIQIDCCKILITNMAIEPDQTENRAARRFNATMDRRTKPASIKLLDFVYQQMHQAQRSWNEARGQVNDSLYYPPD